MSEHYMPFGSSSGDRKVTSADFARYFGAFIGDGVLVNPSTNLQVLANSAMTVTLKLGMGFINHGYFYYNDGDYTLTIDTADGVMNRKDNIVIRWDIDTRSVSAQVVKGTPASSAVAPALVRTNEQYDLKIAEISIPAGTTAITQGLITDTRANSSVCGYSTGVLQQIDATTLFAQFTASFNTWFDEMKGQLSTDAAGNLLNLINNHKADYGNPHQVTATQTGAATLHPFTSTLTTAWNGAGPYTQAITASGITADDKPIIGPVYDSDLTTREAQHDAWNMITFYDTSANTITFTCDEDKPTVAIPIQIQVVR